MGAIDVKTDTDTLTLRLTAEFDAPPEQVWQVWADPRKLERWWGPPTHPATVVDHDLTPGGRVRYFMTGPEGDRYHGWWRIIAADTPNSLEFEDGFADANAEPDPNMPTTVALVTLTARDSGGTTMVLLTTFPNLAAMEQMIAMGIEPGITQAVGQIDTLLG